MREGLVEPCSFLGESVHVRRDGVGISVSSEFWPHVFSHDPNDIRSVGGGFDDACEAKEQEGEEAFQGEVIAGNEHLSLKKPSWGSQAPASGSTRSNTGRSIFLLLARGLRYLLGIGQLIR